MKLEFAAALMVLLLVACAQVETKSDPVEIWPQDPDGNLVLYVSNQSFDISPVDITILIDGKVAVEADFAVENQHNFVKHVFSVPPGTHKIEVHSRTGEAELQEEFHISGRHWAGVHFWYYAPQFGKEMPRQIEFEIQDKPMMFM